MLIALLVVLMLAALVGMIVCNKQKNNPMAQPIAFALLLVVIVCGGLLMWNMGVFGGNNMDDLRNNENKFYVSQGFMAGQALKGQVDGQTLLVIDPSNSPEDERYTGFIEQYRAGLGNPNAEVVIDTLDVVQPNSEPGMEIPLFELMKAKDYDALLAKYPDVKAVVTTIGLPRDAARMKYWTMAADKRPLLFLVGMSESRGLGSAIASGAVAGMITIGPKAVFNEDPAPSNPAEAFAVRYVLIDKNNVGEFKSMLGE